MKFEKPYIIVEIGVNYYDIATQRGISPIEAAKFMILEAKKAGADAAKFQTYKAETLASIHSPSYWDLSKEPTTSQYVLFKKFDSFGFKEYEELATYAKILNIDFLSTPFDLESVDYLVPLMKYIKIASADITNYPLLKKVASKQKPIMLSTGASTIEEIKEALTILNCEDIVLMHCVLSYPTQNEDANLYRIQILKDLFPHYVIGYSDHTYPDPNMVITSSAFVLGARVIEKHFTLDKGIQGNDHFHSMDVEDLKKLRHNLDLLNTVFSQTEKNYLPCEEIPRKQARRSLVASHFIPKGKVLDESDLICKRPGTGISPKDMDQIMGKIVLEDIQEDDLLTWQKIQH